MQHAPIEPSPSAIGDLSYVAAPPPGANATGSVAFHDACQHKTESQRGTLEVRLERMSPHARGHLFEQIEDAIERELRTRGGAPPGIGSSRDADAMLSDQLFRARQVGAARIAVRLPSLGSIADVSRALGAEDSETLLFWARATRERPVDLVLDASDARLSAHVRPLPLTDALGPSRGEAAARPVPSPRVIEAVLEQTVPDHWRTATLALTAARGPQPLAALERLFAASYLPLDRSLRNPSWTPDPRAVHARDDFKDNFSRVYVEAFNSFGVTGKRPKMVLDAPAIAGRIARQTSARTSQLLLVDGMRHDVGAMVKDELVKALAEKASLTHEMILWSALPTTTTHQLTTLAHGLAALEARPEAEREDSAIRGRTAQTIRRLKVGSRDVYRLDLCDMRVHEAGESALPLLPGIAAEVAGVIAKHALTLAPRTLLFVFGDHGFTLGRDGEPQSGGASPEEVLVPAFGFLVGEAH